MKTMIPTQLLDFSIDGKRKTVEIHDLIIAGWTGRDADAVERHIVELEAIGVPRPRTTPIFYRPGVNLLTTAECLDVVGRDTSGEVEFVLVSAADGLFVGVGSDHTDRKVETRGVTLSKQVCPKPISSSLWPMDEVKDRWDSLVLRSWTRNSEKCELYQEGTVANMLAPARLINQYCNGTAESLPAGTVMYCGTLPLLRPIEYGQHFEIELDDPARRRSLRHAYTVRTLTCAD